MTKKKIQHDQVCMYCKKPAEINLQTMYHRYDLTSEGDYINEKSWSGNTNEHLCRKCAKTEYTILPNGIFIRRNNLIIKKGINIWLWQKSEK